MDTLMFFFEFARIIVTWGKYPSYTEDLKKKNGVQNG